MDRLRVSAPEQRSSDFSLPTLFHPVTLRLHIVGILAFDNLRAVWGIPGWIRLQCPLLMISHSVSISSIVPREAPDLSYHLYWLIQHDEEERYLSSLRGLELARLEDPFTRYASSLPHSAQLRSRPYRL